MQALAVVNVVLGRHHWTGFPFSVIVIQVRQKSILKYYYHYHTIKEKHLLKHLNIFLLLNINTVHSLNIYMRQWRSYIYSNIPVVMLCIFSIYQLSNVKDHRVLFQDINNILTACYTITYCDLSGQFRVMLNDSNFRNAVSWNYLSNIYLNAYLNNVRHLVYSLNALC